MLAVGAPIDNGLFWCQRRVWRLRVFTYMSESQLWSQVGFDIEPTQDWGQLGISVALSGDGMRLAAGAYFTRPQLTDQRGRVIVYEQQNGTWQQIGQHIDGEMKDSLLGWSVAMSS